MIADALRDRIRTGDLKAGDRLPTQADLAQEFGVEQGAVRQALRLLAEAGLLTNASKESLPRIAEPAALTRGEPQPTMVGLAPRLTGAFSESNVRMDVVCHTVETLMVALGEPLRHIHEGRLSPRSIEVRILVAPREITLAFPVPVDGDGEDNSVHERRLSMRNAQGQVVRHNLLALRATHGMDVKVTFRALPFTPPVKLYLFNGAEALLGYHMPTRREEEYGSVLFSFLRQTGQRDAAFVEQSQKWFNALWETITTDLTLSW